MDLGLVEDQAGDEMSGREFTVFMFNLLFLQGVRYIPGTLNLHELVAATVKNPDIDALEVRDILDVGGSGHDRIAGR